jgi:hypothetical protein
MTAIEDPLAPQVGRLQVPRTRGAVSGILLVLLGAWGALAPFVGPYFDFGFGTDRTWVWTSTRGWLEVLPGAAVAVGGLLLLVSAHRVVASLGGWLAAAGGAWFVVGLSLADLLHIGSLGTPIDTGTGHRSLESLSLFYGLGALVVFLAAGAVGRLSVRSVRDVRAALRNERTEETEPADETDRPALITAPAPIPPQTVDLSGPRHFDRREAAHAAVVEPYPTTVTATVPEVSPVRAAEVDSTGVPAPRPTTQLP